MEENKRFVSQVGGSAAVRPDLDWSQVRETVLMLGLAIAQIEMAMRDSNNSVNTLLGSFSAMASHVDEINREVEGLASRGKTGQVRKSVLEKCSLVSDEMRDAIMAFQFYDKLVQRLDHVCLSVDGLAELVSDRGRLFLPDEWVSLQDRIRSKYTMEEERLMFEAILQGSTIQQALENFVKAMEARSAQSGNDDVELF